MLRNMAPRKVIQFLSPFFGSYLTHAKIQRRLRSRKERFQFIREGNYVFFNICWIYKRKPVYEEPFCSRTPFSAETARENPRETFAKFSSLVSFFYWWISPNALVKVQNLIYFILFVGMCTKRSTQASDYLIWPDRLHQKLALLIASGCGNIKISADLKLKIIGLCFKNFHSNWGESCFGFFSEGSELFKICKISVSF